MSLQDLHREEEKGDFVRFEVWCGTVEVHCTVRCVMMMMFRDATFTCLLSVRTYVHN